MNNHRAAIFGVIAIVTIAALLPGIAAVDYALGEAVWVLLADDTPAVYEVPVAHASEQPDPLLSPLASRAPPSSLHA